MNPYASRHMDALETQIRTGIDDAKADFPEVGEHDIVHDIVTSQCAGHSVGVRDEMRRRFGL